MARTTPYTQVSMQEFSSVDILIDESVRIRDPNCKIQTENPYSEIQQEFKEQVLTASVQG